MDVDRLTQELARWAHERDRDLDVGDVHTVLMLAVDYVDSDPARMDAADLRRLLMEIYPRKITVSGSEDLTEVIPSMRVAVEFMADTGRISTSRLKSLNAALDEVEPRFVDEVMNPANWGMARGLMQGMLADDVDPSDEAAVNTWILNYNARQAGTWPFDDPARDSLADVSGAAAPSPLGFAWFPRAEFDEARRRWPAFAEAWEEDEYPAYIAARENAMTEASRLGARCQVVLLNVDALVEWTAARDVDPGESRTHAEYAAHALSHQAKGIKRWPPERNSPCWCESGRKYKKCCGSPSRREAP